VIGGDLSGVAAAWELARRGTSVAMLEKGVIGGDSALWRRGLQGMAEAYPARKGLKIATASGGMVDCTPDAIPVIGPVHSRTGLHISAGHTGHGFGIGQAPGDWRRI
jgi:glycine/D-amino acid oxidase-like deaminating enzyme